MGDAVSIIESPARLIEVAPLAGFDMIDRRIADELLVEWDHWLGGCNRPFGIQAFGLSIEGTILAVATSASTVQATGGGYQRQEVVELARLCAHPDHRAGSESPRSGAEPEAAPGSAARRTRRRRSGPTTWHPRPGRRANVGESRDTHAWCPACREESAIDKRRRCLWCGGPTKQRTRRGGWKRPDIAGSRYSEEQLRALHVAHMRGASINALAKQTYERVGYASPGTAATTISREWKRLGLRARDRIEQTVLSSTKHGRKRRNVTNAEQNAYRRWLAKQRGWKAVQGPGQERCAGIRRNHPRKGEPCERPAMEGSRYCWAHDPAAEAARVEHLAEMRSRATEREMVPMAPFTAWLNHRRAELGTNRALAASIGLSPSMVTAYLRGANRGGPITEIGRDVIERCLEADGTASFADLYGADVAQLDPASFADVAMEAA